MFSKIYQKESNLRKHLDAPLLHEREAYIAHMKEKGYCLRYQQIKATYLLYAVNNLPLKSNEPIPLASIVALRDSYEKSKIENMKEHGKPITDDTKANDFMCTVVDFLDTLGLVDSRITDKSNLFNVLFDPMSVKIKYMCAPLYEERMSYLLHLRSVGMSHQTIREYAEAQVHIIEYIGKDLLSGVSESDILKAWFLWDEHCRLFYNKKSHKRDSIFFRCAHRWLNHIGLLQRERVIVPGMEKVDAYCDWALNEKGFATCTITSLRINLSNFFTFINKHSIVFHSIALSDIDGYLEYRHNHGCSRRTIATIVTVLRGFLKYAFMCDWIAKDISNAIQGPRLFSHETLPYSPKWDEVEMIAGFYGRRHPMFCS